MSSCAIVCGASLDKLNSCDHGTFAYTCQCINGKTPDMSLWTLTMPTHLCLRAADVCINTAADESGRQLCRGNILANCSTRAPVQMDLVQQGSDGMTNPSAVWSTVTSDPSATPSSSSAGPTLVITTLPTEPSMTLGPLIAGVVVGAIVFIIATASLFYWLGSRRRRQSSEKDQQRRRDRLSPQPPISQPSESTLVAGEGFTEVSTIQKLNSEQASTIDKEVVGGSTGGMDEKSDGFKTLVTEKLQRHEMVRDLSAASALDDEMYFDTAKYRMLPPDKVV